MLWFWNTPQNSGNIERVKMIFIIMCIIVLLVGLHFYFDEGFWIALGFAFGTALTCGLVFILIGLGIYTTGQKHEYKAGKSTETELLAMNNSTGIQGRAYFLGGGYVNDTQTITYMYKTSDGGVRLGKQDATQSTVYEVAGNPKMVTTHYTNKLWWFAPFNTGSVDQYAFHVPNGTIHESYELDLEGK